MAIMKTYRITMILVALTWTAAAMTTPIDSLYRRICSTPRADIGEVNRLLMLLDADGITDSLIQHDRHAPREGMMAATHLYMADYFYDRKADMTATIQAARRAEQAACRAQDTLRIEEALAYQAVAASRMGQIDVALKATKEELRLDSLSGQRPNLARAYNTLAGLSLQAGRTDDARLYVRKAIEIERTLEDTSHLGVRYGLAAEIYAKTGELDRALDYALQAYAIDRKAGDRTKTARRLSQMADIYAQKGDHRQAERFYLRSIDSLRAADERKSLAINLKQLGQFYARQQRWKESRQALTECEQICRATGNYYTLQQTCRLMADVLAGENPTQAIAYLQEALQLTDSLHSQRAEDLAVELRKSQAEALAETTQQGAATASHPPLHILLLLTLTAAIGIVGHPPCRGYKGKDKIADRRERLADSRKHAKNTDEHPRHPVPGPSVRNLRSTPESGPTGHRRTGIGDVHEPFPVYTTYDGLDGHGGQQLFQPSAHREGLPPAEGYRETRKHHFRGMRIRGPVLLRQFLQENPPRDAHAIPHHAEDRLTGRRGVGAHTFFGIFLGRLTANG